MHCANALSGFVHFLHLDFFVYFVYKKQKKQYASQQYRTRFSISYGTGQLPVHRPLSAVLSYVS